MVLACMVSEEALNNFKRRDSVEYISVPRRRDVYIPDSSNLSITASIALS